MKHKHPVHKAPLSERVPLKTRIGWGYGGLADNTVIVFTSDHGNLLGEHGMIFKSFGNGCEELFNVPLLVRVPGLVEGGRQNALVRNIEISGNKIISNAPAIELSGVENVVPKNNRFQSLDGKEMAEPIHEENSIGIRFE